MLRKLSLWIINNLSHVLVCSIVAYFTGSVFVILLTLRPRPNKAKLCKKYSVILHTKTSIKICYVTSRNKSSFSK